MILSYLVNGGGGISDGSLEEMRVIVEALLKAGAKIVRNKDGYSPLDYLVDVVKPKLLDDLKRMKIPEKGVARQTNKLLEIEKLLTAEMDKYKKQCAYSGIMAKEGKEFSRCARCQLVYYDSRASQEAHWKEHKLECVKVGQRPCPPPMGMNPRTKAMRFF